MIYCTVLYYSSPHLWREADRAVAAGPPNADVVSLADHDNDDNDDDNANGDNDDNDDNFTTGPPEHQTTRLLDHQITRSPDHQTTKLLNYQTTRPFFYFFFILFSRHLIQKAKQYTRPPDHHAKRIPDFQTTKPLDHQTKDHKTTRLLDHQSCVTWRGGSGSSRLPWSWWRSPS